MMLALVLALMAQPAPEPAPTSLLVITLDTFRGDHLGADTPNLRRLSARGVTFTRARSPIPLTLPSHASMFTGLYPPEHGVRDNARFILGDEHATLAETLRERGYETAAFVGSFVLDRRFGLAQGFDVYDDQVQTGVGSLENPEAERPGSDVVEAFESWLSGRQTARPFFAWVHLYDPHAPYEPPAPHPATYAGEIAFTDELVGRIVASVPPSSLIAVIGDHGEGLGDHDEPTHALFIYNTTLHVPFLLAGPSLPEGRDIAALVRTIDLPATLLDYLGFPGSFGRGTSLRALVENDSREARVAYSESLYGSYHFGFAPLFGIETDRFRFIDAPRRELYDLSADPAESRDRLSGLETESRDLLQRLEALRAELGDTSDGGAVIDEETRASLESLGYVTTAPAAPNRRDPKDEVDVYNRVQMAQVQRGRGQCETAVASLKPLVEELDYPVAVAYEVLGACHVEAGRIAEAREVYERALARGLESARFHVELGVIAYREGDLARAEQELDVALALEPWNVTAHYHLGNVYRASRRNQEAVRAYQEALRLNDAYVYAWTGLGMTRSRLGDEEGTLAAFRRVVALQPDEPRGYFNLAVQLERMGRKAEAVPIYRHFLSIAPAGQFARERQRARAALR